MDQPAGLLRRENEFGSVHSCEHRGSEVWNGYTKADHPATGPRSYPERPVLVRCRAQERRNALLWARPPGRHLRRCVIRHGERPDHRPRIDRSGANPPRFAALTVRSALLRHLGPGKPFRRSCPGKRALLGRLDGRVIIFACPGHASGCAFHGQREARSGTACDSHARCISYGRLSSEKIPTDSVDNPVENSPLRRKFPLVIRRPVRLTKR